MASLEPFLNRWPGDAVLPLSPQQRQDVIDLLGAFQLPNEHPRANEGEIATYVAALQLRDEGRPHVVVIDDGDGRRLFRRAAGLVWAGTAELTFEMVESGVLTIQDGGRVWRATYSDQRLWARYPAVFEAWKVQTSARAPAEPSSS